MKEPHRADHLPFLRRCPDAVGCMAAGPGLAALAGRVPKVTFLASKGESMFRLVVVGALMAGLYFLFTRLNGEKRTEEKEPGDDPR